MKLAIVGYGKMGKLIEQLAPECGFTMHAHIDVGDDIAKASGADVAIEFTTPEAAAGNIEKLAALKVPIVVGTTGWLDQRERVEAAIERNKTGLVWSPNFSIGVNVFFRLAQEAARLMADEPIYGAWAWEIHHDTKKDAPSGTMLKLVEDMKAAGYPRDIDVSSNRGGTSSGNARNRLRFGGGHDHASPRGPQPRGVRARCVKSCTMDCREARRV